MRLLDVGDGRPQAGHLLEQGRYLSIFRRQFLRKGPGRPALRLLGVTFLGLDVVVTTTTAAATTVVVVIVYGAFASVTVRYVTAFVGVTAGFCNAAFCATFVLFRNGADPTAAAAVTTAFVQLAARGAAAVVVVTANAIVVDVEGFDLPEEV